MGSVTVTITTPGCICCEPCTTGTLSCRTRGGIATLCGISEFGSPSTPPKKYLHRHQTDTRNYCCYTDSTCSVISSSTTFDGDSVCDYSSTDCSLTQTQHFKVYSNTGVCPGTTLVENIPDAFDCNEAPPSAIPGFPVGVSTSTQVTLVPVSGCANIAGSNYCGGYANVSGGATDTLSNEDTESNAISRLLAGSGGTWSSWVDGTPTTCLARFEQRTSGFSFVYQEAQWRITASGLTPGTTCAVPMQVWRRTYGVGSYVLLSTFTATGAADGGGNLDIEGTVDNLRGYETYVQQGSC